MHICRVKRPEVLKQMHLHRHGTWHENVPLSFDWIFLQNLNLENSVRPSQAESELRHRQTLRKILITTSTKERQGLCFVLGIPGVEGITKVRYRCMHGAIILHLRYRLLSMEWKCKENHWVVSRVVGILHSVPSFPHSFHVYKIPSSYWFSVSDADVGSSACT